MVKLLARLLSEHGRVNAIFTNVCVCLAALALQEGPSFEELTQQVGLELTGKFTNESGVELPGCCWVKGGL